MKAAFVRNGGGVELRNVARPQLIDGSILVRMKASGICGTDLEKVRGRNITSSIIGHEASGIIVESGSSAFRVGSRVVPHHHVACGRCHLCKVGAETMCLGFKNSNFEPGGFSEEFLVPAYNVKNGGVHEFSTSLSFEEASFAEPLACCIRGLEKAVGSKLRSEPLEIAVVGAGPIGLMHMELIKMRMPESKVLAVDINESRLTFAEKNENASVLDSSNLKENSFSEKALSMSHGDGFDLVIVATGSSRAFDEAIKCVRPAGSLLLFGAPHRGSTHQLDIAKLFLQELKLFASYSATDGEISAALLILENHSINVNKFISSRFPLNRVEDAFGSAGHENQIKVVVTG
ncbi:MAG: alcohol dehydrogenase catalytic domain-containing protein [Nitrososphaerales archaeon]